MTIRTDSTFWSPDDDRMLAIWIEHGYPATNDVAHLLDVTVRAVNIMRQWQCIAADLVHQPAEATADLVASHLAFQGLTESDADTLHSVAATVRKILCGEPIAPESIRDGLGDAIAAYAGVSPDLVQVFPRKPETQQ